MLLNLKSCLSRDQSIFIIETSSLSTIAQESIRSWSLVPNKDWLIVRLCHDTPSQWPWRIYSFWVQFLSNMWWLTFLRSQHATGWHFPNEEYIFTAFRLLFFFWPSFSLFFSSLIIFILIYLPSRIKFHPIYIYMYKL